MPTSATWSAEARVLDIVDRELKRRIGEGIASGALADQSAAIGRLFNGVSSARIRTIAFEIAGTAGAAWTDDDGELAFSANDYLMRQVSCIGGGTTEMARNVISERRARDAPGTVGGPGRSLPRRTARRRLPPALTRCGDPDSSVFRVRQLAGQATDLVSRYWSNPAIPFCRPTPLSLYPPNGRSGL